MEIDALYETELLVTSSRKAVKVGRVAADQYARSKSSARSKLTQMSDRLIAAAREADRKGGNLAKNAGVDKAKVDLSDMFERELRALITER